VDAPPTVGSTGSRFVATVAELRELFDEAADVDWRHPAFSALVVALASSEVLSGRRLTPDRAAAAFVTALQANSGPAADTFMAVAAGAPSSDPRARVVRAAERARVTAQTLRTLDRVAPGQRLLQTLRLDDGWLRPLSLGDGTSDDGPVAIAFLTRGAAYVAEVDPRDRSPDLADALERTLAGRETRFAKVDPESSRPTLAAAAVALEPVPLTWARSFHRLAWTRGGGPWMGVADCPPFGVVSTCHAAVDGYAHARVTASIHPSFAGASLEGRPAELAPFPVSRFRPPEVGFATCRIEGASPRFADALHAFATVLDRRLGGGPSRSVPFHVPIAPGLRTDSSRWRRRPLYGLLALERHDGALESLEELRARLPRFLAREASGAGILTRVLRAALELPAPASVRRLLVDRQPWTDRWIAPAQVLTGGGYVSWMRFDPNETPVVATHPSAVPSFSADRGGAGLSIAPFLGGLACGLTTSGSIGTSDAAAELLEEWRSVVEGAIDPQKRGVVHTA
jgi:hypothetical protein